MIFFLTTISEAIVYTCFALLMGSYIFSLFPADLKPKIIVSQKIKLFAVAGIAIFSFTPLLSLVTFLYEDHGLWQTLKSIIFTFGVGRAWLFLAIFSIILGLYIFFFDKKTSAIYSVIGIILIFVLIAGLGWSGHASSISPVKGFITHFTHFASVVVWVGILLIVSWFSRNTDNWSNFLKWFHVMALYCFAIVMITGLSLMNLSMEWSAYPDSWMLSYGQSLLIKHLLIIPLIGYAFINGIVMKRKLKKEGSFDPRPWTRVEFFVILLIFVATGAMSQQSPPSNIAQILSSEGISPLFGLFYDGAIQPSLNAQLVPKFDGILLGIVSICFFTVSILTFFKKMPPLFSFIMSILVVISAYLALLLSVQVV
ncbi:copper resistance D family protein [Psychrobacillus sp. OK032]|uniref:copper resistance D family protein n=1 Tax=Psychrobacillus sp. OK032 TaxID=1884358 RepID=UPI0008B23673|nr:CopD family protein [Psychrobacillus sp. OK032]SES11334.1 putative copper resistance protein D [Psychrobacillus sp. OK032]